MKRAMTPERNVCSEISIPIHKQSAGINRGALNFGKLHALDTGKHPAQWIPNYGQFARVAGACTLAFISEDFDTRFFRG